MSSFTWQLRVLLWKNWLSVLRQPVLSFILILWPVSIFSILAITRTRFLPEPMHNCYLAPRNLQSTGLFPFLQTFYCDDYARCKTKSYVKKASSRIYRKSSGNSMEESPHTDFSNATKTTLTTLVEEHTLLYLEDSQNSSLNWTRAIPVHNRRISIEQMLNDNLTTGDIKSVVCNVVSKYLKTNHETLNQYCLGNQLEFGLQEIGNIVLMILSEPENQILLLTDIVNTIIFIRQQWNDNTALLDFLVMLPNCFDDAISNCSTEKQMGNPTVTSNNSLFKNILKKIPCFLNCFQRVKQGDTHTSDTSSWQSLKAWFEIVAANKFDYASEESHYWHKMKPYVGMAYWLITSLSRDKIATSNCQFNISGPNVVCNSSINWIQFYQSAMVLMKDITHDPVAKERLLKLEEEFQKAFFNQSTDSPYKSFRSCLRNLNESLWNQSREYLQEMGQLIQSAFAQKSAFSNSSLAAEFLYLKTLELRNLTNHLCLGSSHQICQLTCQYLLLVLDVAEFTINTTKASNAAAGNVTVSHTGEASSRRTKPSNDNLGDLATDGLNTNWFFQDIFPFESIQNVINYLSSLPTFQNISTLDYQARVGQLFGKSKQVEMKLFNLGMSNTSIQAMMNMSIPNDKFQNILWFNELLECHNNHKKVPEEFQEFCNTTAMQRYQMAVIFLQHIDLLKFIYQMFLPTKWQQTLDKIPVYFKLLDQEVNRRKSELLHDESIVNLINMMNDIEHLDYSKTAVNSRLTNIEPTSLQSILKSSCTNNLLLPLISIVHLSNSSQDSGHSNMTEEGMTNYGIPLNISSQCQKLIWSLVSTPSGAIAWNSLKPMLLGKILYTPHTPETEKIMNKSVSMLAEINKVNEDVKRKLNILQDNFLLFNKLVPILKDIQVILRDPLKQHIIMLLKENNITELENDLDKFENLISQIESYENKSNGLIPLFSTLSKMLNCISYDRLLPFNSTKKLQNNAMNLLRTNDLLASVIFQIPSTSRRRRRASSDKPILPSHVKYTIRMKNEFSEPSDRLRDVYWVPGPHNSAIEYQSYGILFVFLQENIDRAIIEMQTQKNLQNIAVQFQPMPYPCYINDMFLYAVSLTFPMMLMIAWVLFIAVFVRKLVYEKDLKLHEYMKIMGVNSCSHFFAWFIESILFLLITIIILIITLKAGKVLPHSNGFILFLFLLDYSLSILAMSYLISSFFSNTNIAALSGSLIYIISFFPYIVLIANENHLSFAAKTLLGLFAPTSFSYASQYISRYESQDVGIQWHNMYLSPVIQDETSFGWFCWLLVIDSFIYFIIGWYISMVFPGKYGIGVQWYFPVLPSFWAEYCGCVTSSSQIESGPLFTFIRAGKEYASFHKKDSKDVHSSNLEPEPSALIAGVSLCQLTKKFLSKAAVQNLNLNFYEGQITALLGHNGAGKTTTISLLTGLFSASSGTILVYGKDIRTHLNQIRKSMGICMQYDVLFDYLTTKEHLLMYAFIKAPQWTKQELHDEVLRALKDIGLYRHRNKPVGSLSGGMRRKLSICIALIGGSKVVILDEPTTGVDPCSRRSIWDIICKHKTGKTIILSTHHLDEAEVLSDRIAFLEHGGLKCCGSPLFLKETFGDGYHLTLTKKYPNLESTEHCDTEAVTSLIQSHIPEARLKEDIGGELIYLLPPFSAEVSGSYLSLLRALDTSMNDIHIGCYGISDTTIEEVFLKLTEGLDSEYGTKWPTTKTVIPVPNDTDSTVIDETSRSSYSFPDRDDLELTKLKKVTGLTLTLKKIIAIFIKRFHNSRRNWKGLIGQILMPVLFVLASMGVGSISIGSTNYPALRLSPSIYGTSGQAVVFENESNSTNNLVSAMLSFPGIETMCMDNSLPRSCYKNLDKWKFDGNQTANYDTCNCSTGFQICKEPNSVPSHTEIFSFQTLYDISGQNMENYFLATSREFVQQRYGGWSFGLPLPSHLKLDIKPVPDNRTLNKVWYNPEGYHSLPAFLNSLNNFILRANLPQNKSSQYGISTWSHPYPGSMKREQTMINVLVNLVVALSILVGYSIMTASFVIYVIKEHHTGAKRLQHISGVSTTCYWITNFVYDMILYLIPVALSIGIIAIFRMPSFFDHQNLVAVFLLLVLFGFSTFAWMYLLAGTFKNSGRAFIVYVSINLFIGIITIIPTVVLYILYRQRNSENLEILIRIMKNVFRIFPQFCFGYGLIELSQQQGIGDLYTLYGIDYKIVTLNMDIVGWLLVAMAIQGTVFFALRLLINETLFQVIRHFVKTKCQRQSHHVVKTVDEDEDVQAERIRVESGRAETDQLQLCGLSKIYHQVHKKIVAVNNMSLGVPAGECFGLLGVNGAGKTTTFKMLTGAIAPSSGSIRIRDQTRNVLDVLDCDTDLSAFGYCPQEDALDKLLTGKEHLYYYARVHGIPEAQIKKVVTQLLHKLQLIPYKDILTSSYSCGTRRKLSTALALVGRPSILLLDEPSSGMDPKTKRHLWKVISEELRDQCAVVLTSHSMEECEALCTRLAIMVNGKFQCIGTLQHIKHRFGSGFTVTMHMKDGEGHADTITQFMCMHFPNTYLKDQHFCMLEYHIPISAGGVANIFDLLETNKSDLNIRHFSVSQTTLDEVFINFAQSQSGQEDFPSTDLGNATSRSPDTNEIVRT
uniref:ATP-binding cassette sub-family A member 12 isoform X2 n=1 Tax=Geotrypetes seraphini TaxID=260995 RepID=A0A6P8QUZ8_GEOSA|nr:ATP-binding cassette sub-family A member 12 isoform X2 [Geotrypetes seraphini]